MAQPITRPYERSHRIEQDLSRELGAAALSGKCHLSGNLTLGLIFGKSVMKAIEANPTLAAGSVFDFSVTCVRDVITGVLLSRRLPGGFTSWSSVRGLTLPTRFRWGSKTALNLLVTQDALPGEAILAHGLLKATAE
jgi:hypothetical protein